jgi:hypothetical protein
VYSGFEAEFCQNNDVFVVLNTNTGCCYWHSVYLLLVLIGIGVKFPNYMVENQLILHNDYICAD